MTDVDTSADFDTLFQSPPHRGIRFNHAVLSQHHVIGDAVSVPSSSGNPVQHVLHLLKIKVEFRFSPLLIGESGSTLIVEQTARSERLFQSPPHRGIRFNVFTWETYPGT